MYPSTPLLEVKDLSKEFIKGKNSFQALRNISFQIKQGEVLGLVGESGSGKSTLAKVIMGLENSYQGQVLFQGKEISRVEKRKRVQLRRKMQIIFQNPYSALNPCMNLAQILEEPLDIHGLFTGSNRLNRIHELLDMVGLNKEQLWSYPDQFSGGQRQRICIARALAVEPDFLICDEVLSALDLSVQAQVINLLRKCQRQLGITMLFISHDLAAVDMLADRVAVMYQGEIIEQGENRVIFRNPLHEYTRELITRNLPITDNFA